MKEFMGKDFMLSNETAKELYKVAKKMPIYDYHCHLNPREIYENKQFRSVTELMLGGDHYKWRAMLSNGAPERCIRGDGSDYEKFFAFASMLKYAIGNPLFHWTHLELRRVFGIEEILNEESAPRIYEQCNQMLATEEFRCRRLIEKFNVKVICTTDDPCDDLQYHKLIAEDPDFSVKVLPAWRPDKAINIDKGGFVDYMGKLARVSGISTLNLADMMRALESRVDYFHACGARISDHGLDTVPYAPPSHTIAGEAYRKAMSGQPLTELEVNTYKTYVLVELGKMYKARGWTMQYHMGALRNNNQRMFDTYGPDTGFDSINDLLIANNLSNLLRVQDTEGNLPKTILYSLNPRDNYVLGTMIGNFQGDEIPGKIQLGSGWWFNDQRDGMVDQMKTLANMGLLGRFVGMLTDSRSFVSYPRHEYFRRILCDVIGTWVENGEYPADMEALGELVQGISFNNARDYFGIPIE